MDQNRGSAAIKGLVVVAVVVIIAVGVILYNNSQNSQPATTPVAENTNNPASGIVEEGESVYQDGTYSSEGNYTSPGGEESIDVTITLVDGVITEADVVSNAERPMSVTMQGQFISGFEDQVIGRNIDEVVLDKVSGSSLTPKGFNNALDEIKEQARA